MPLVRKWQRVDRATAIYALIDPSTGEIRYVGKTTQKLRGRLATHISHAKNGPRDKRSYWSLHWVRALLDAGRRPEIFEIELVPEGGDWAEAEQFWIEMCRAWGFGLCNHRPGGEAGNFNKQSAESVEKRASKLRGRPGRKMTPEERARNVVRLQAARAAINWTPEKRRRVMEAMVRASALVPRRKGADNPASRPIVVAGVTYPGVSEAMRQVGVTRRTVYNWLRDGCAAYADEIEPGRAIPSPEELYDRPRRGSEVVGALGTYPSKHFLARKLGIDVSTITYRLEHGLQPDAPPQPTGLRAARLITRENVA